MNPYILTHLSDPDLARELSAQNTCEFRSTAILLAYIAEFDDRRLYAPAGYSSMFAYCLQVLGRTEEATYKRIHAARTARRFPAIFPMVADGRLQLSGVILLAPHLTPENAEDLLTAASGRTKGQIEHLVATRFPREERADRLRALSWAGRLQEHAPGRVETPTFDLDSEGRPSHSPEAGNGSKTEHAPGRVEGPTADLAVTTSVPSSCGTEHAPGRVVSVAPLRKLAPVSAERFELRVTIDRTTRDKMHYLQRLLGQYGNRDLAELLDQSFDALIAKVEKHKFGSGSDAVRPSTGANPRYIPESVRRAVRRRDEGQCTFVSDSGHRCSELLGLEFDHVWPVARGGPSTVGNLRLRCRAHNQLEAERMFGAGFMREKREAAASAAD